MILNINQDLTLTSKCKALHFALSQTDGKELPEIGVSELSAQVEGYQNFMKALEMVSTVPIEYEDIPGEAKGYYHTSEKRVAIQQGMSESQTVKTAIHEVAHAKLHNRELNHNSDISERKDRNTKEVEAESIAYAVCQHFGIDTTDYSFGYIAGWSSGKEMTELKSSLDTIRRTASELINGIEGQLLELEQEIAIEETQDIVLLVANTDRSEYDLVNVRGMEREELFHSLLVMNDDDRLSVEAYLESKGGWVTPLANEQSEEVEEYHLDYIYNTDTHEITDVKAVQPIQKNEQETVEVADTATEYENLPDENISLSEMHEYGYTWAEMLPLTKERALELFEHDLTLYQLHTDGSESFIDDRDMVTDHNGIFGIEKGDWEQYVKLHDAEQNLEESEANREALLLYGRDNQLGIYQLNDSEIGRDMRFMNSDFHEMKGVAISRENYNLVYTAPLEDGTGLEDIFQRFNIDRPEDFRGHSLSVSDVVVLHQNGENTFHFVDSVGYKDVPEFIRETEQELQAEHTSHIEETVDILEEIAEEHTREEPERENDKVSYYVIADLSTWAENSPERSKLERFDSFEEALTQFKAYREKDAQFTDDKARTTLGFSVQGSEFDVIHVRNNENVLSLDFTHSSTATQSNHFMDDLQILCNELVDKVRVHRDMSPEEVKDFVKNRFIYQLQNSGFDDVSMYMERFETLYEQGKMEHLMPTANQKHIVEDIPLVEWENEYISINNRYADIADKELSVVEYQALLGMEISQVSVDGLMEIMNFEGELWNYPMEEKEHCLQENIPVVTVRDGEEARYFEIPEELVAKVRESEFRGYEPEQMAVSIADRYISIQAVEGGYDYSIMGEDYKELDGGVYDNPDISIHKALNEIVLDLKQFEAYETLRGSIKAEDEIQPIDYDGLMEKVEEANRIQPQSSVVEDFKAKTEEMFHSINGQTQDDVEQTVWAYLQSKIEEYNIDIELVDVVVSGSRCRGLEQEGSDIDVVVEYKGEEREDDLFNAFNEDGLKIGGVKVDINPITEGKSGTLEQYLPTVETYLAEKQAAMQTEQKEAITEKTVTLTVAECGEFHNLGEFYEGIVSVDEAIAIFNQIPSERMNGVKSIGINIHTEGTKPYEDVQMDIVSGKVADLEMLDYVPDISDDPKAVAVIGELIDKLPDIEVRGSLEKWQIATLAAEIDQFSYDLDTYEYRNTVGDRDEQVASITEDIRSGNTEYLHDFLNAVIAEGVRNGITDMFGQGVEPDDSEAIQNMRKAKELLDRLSEYKPLAKVEELTEGNYNMVDNVLNNGVEKKEQEQITGRISIKEKLAEKKAVIERKDKPVPEKDAEKKKQREM